MNILEDHFSGYRSNIIGMDQHFVTPYGRRRLVYADWTASARAYQPIESYLQKEVLPFVGNTHTATTITGTLMSEGYAEAKRLLKAHVNASSDDVLLFVGSGMTSAVNKLQRLLGLKDSGGSRPVVFVSHMEHHSNHISWLETAAEVEVIQPASDGNIDLTHLESLLRRYRNRRIKIAAITASSNVTGLETPYHEVARLLHQHGGWCFVDFACAAPYVSIDMHPGPQDASRDAQGTDQDARGTHLDAIYFSMHKFLGGPGTPGVLVFNKSLYRFGAPDQPGGGTVDYTNPWGGRKYASDIETREDGGTPPFLQAIKAALCVGLKEQMGIPFIRAREAEQVRRILFRLLVTPGVRVLAPSCVQRLGVISFTVEGAHYNLIVKLLNDRFGIQMRGGCSCAGPYGHYLLGVDQAWSSKILRAILSGDLSVKPGWVRLSIHPTMTDEEIDFILEAIESVAANFALWGEDYRYDPHSNEYVLDGFEQPEPLCLSLPYAFR
jgi:selenocysteine lyase/cysteine desulfurase